MTQGFEKGSAREIVILLRGHGPNGLQHGGEEVDQGHGRFDRGAVGHVRSGEDERDGGRFLVHRELAKDPSGAKVLTVVRGVGDSGRVGQAVGVQRVEDLPDLAVQVGADAEVGGGQVAEHGLGEGLGEVEEPAEMVDGRVVWPVLSAPLWGQRKIILWVETEKGFG